MQSVVLVKPHCDLPPSIHHVSAQVDGEVPSPSDAISKPVTAKEDVPTTRPSDVRARPHLSADIALVTDGEHNTSATTNTTTTVNTTRFTRAEANETADKARPDVKSSPNEHKVVDVQASTKSSVGQQQQQQQQATPVIASPMADSTTTDAGRTRQEPKPEQPDQLRTNQDKSATAAVGANGVGDVAVLSGATMLNGTATDRPSTDAPPRMPPPQPPVVSKQQQQAQPRATQKPIPTFYFPFGTTRMTAAEMSWEMDRAKKELNRLAESLLSQEVEKPTEGSLSIAFDNFDKVSKVSILDWSLLSIRLS